MAFLNTKRAAVALAFAVCVSCEADPPAQSPVVHTRAETIPATPAGSNQGGAQAENPAAIDTAVDAYVYGYALMTSEVTRVQSTNVPKPESLRAPMNQFANVKTYPPATFRGVTAPNADTLYSVAWLDLAEPQVFSHPDMGKRYYLFQMMDAWTTDFRSVGARTDGYKAATYLVTGPGWTGQVPKGMTHVSSATRYVVILGRTYADGTDKDFRAVHALQAKYELTPLAAWGKKHTPAPAAVDPHPPFSMTDGVQKVLLQMPASAYFDRLAQSMCKDAPPAQEDAPMLDRMATIGVEPCKPFDAARLGPGAQAALAELPTRALAKIDAHRGEMGAPENQWLVGRDLGRYGTNYMKRAVVAAFGWGANRPEDAVYSLTERAGTGEKLTGANAYTVTFAKGQTPPVHAFWSVTMYEDDKGLWFYPNAANKFTVSPRDHLVKNADGSTTLYVQHDSPGRAKEPNWLPAPSGPFALALRMYWPDEKPPTILDGSWKPPAVVEAGP